MTLTSTSGLEIEQTPETSATSVCPQFPPASLGGSPKLAGGSDPCSFQFIASVLGPRVCEILCAPFKSGVFISYSPLVHLKESTAGLQSRKFWGLVFLMRKPNVGFRSLAPWGESLQLKLFSCLWVAHLGVRVLTILHFHLSFPSCGSFFIFLVVEDLFCWILVVLISSCSVNISSCIFGVPMGDAFRVFLLHHLDHIHFISFMSVL